MAEAVHEEFLRLYQPIHTQFVRYCSNHAYGLMDTEDLVQEAVLATLQKFHSIREKEKLLGYLIATANNIIRNHLRRKKFSGQFNEKDFRKLESNCHGHSSPAFSPESIAGERQGSDFAF